MNEKYAAPLLRIALSLVFLWFGINQLTSPNQWTSYVPGFLSNYADTLVLLNGIFEVCAGLMMLAGIKTRIVASLLSLHLFGIAISLGYNAIAIRDFGLAFATLAVALKGDDWASWKRK